MPECVVFREFFSGLNSCEYTDDDQRVQMYFKCKAIVRETGRMGRWR